MGRLPHVILFLFLLKANLTMFLVHCISSKLHIIKYALYKYCNLMNTAVGVLNLYFLTAYGFLIIKL